MPYSRQSNPAGSLSKVFKYFHFRLRFRRLPSFCDTKTKFIDRTLLKLGSNIVVKLNSALVFMTLSRKRFVFKSNGDWLWLSGVLSTNSGELLQIIFSVDSPMEWHSGVSFWCTFWPKSSLVSSTVLLVSTRQYTTFELLIESEIFSLVAQLPSRVQMTKK